MSSFRIDPLYIYRTARRYYRDYKRSGGEQIKLYNFHWTSPNLEYHWLLKFIEGRNYLRKFPKRSLSIFGINGDKIAMDINRSYYKIFYTIENVHVVQSPWFKYRDLLLEKANINLSLGFDYIEHPQYLRFPYWVMTTFKPDDDYQSIIKKCEHLNKPSLNLNERNRFCSFICRSDYFGERKKILEQVSKVDFVHCDGEFGHNNDDLKVQYNNDKREYLKLFRFNLCPENSNSEGYVTEKIFDAIVSGCVPVYWGSNNNPESEILNHEAILFFDMHTNNSSMINLLEDLNCKPSKYIDFASQPRLLINAPEIIFGYFQRLDQKLKEIFN